MKTKYPIKKEYFPFNKFTAPKGKKTILLAQKYMKTPKFLYKDKDLVVENKIIDGYKEEKIEIYIISPKYDEEILPCILFVHGGGFVYEGFSSHYRLAMIYAKRCRARVIYVKYKLAPNYPFPYQQYECYNVYKYIFDHYDELKIDKTKIALTGDSAGAFLCVSPMLIAHEEGKDYKPLCQVLVYPWLDNRNDSESNKKYTDTPMWNSTLSKNAGNLTNPNNIKFPPHLISPVEYHDLSFLPQAHIEVAEFDCLHDDGVLFSNLLKENNIEVEFYEVKGTMHGYDTKLKAPTTAEMVEKRINYLNRKFKNID